MLSSNEHYLSDLYGLVPTSKRYQNLVHSELVAVASRSRLRGIVRNPLQRCYNLSGTHSRCFVKAHVDGQGLSSVAVQGHANAANRKTSIMEPPFRNKPLYDRLPLDVWETILQHLDVASLLSVVEAEPALKSCAFSKGVLRSATVTPDTDDRTFRKFRLVKVYAEGSIRKVFAAHHVVKLCFNGCLALSSKAILDCAFRCQRLQQLCIVNCVVDPVELFCLLCENLRSVTKLECSLLEERCYDQRLLSKAANDINACCSHGTT
ncbi:hypothetical protein HPB49_001015 [Dermacentor silvarum]|uniref:Uncharacterized protein n=1 Tax=Dermacentor silvarum TaxID=543639 RepID=A0ACB8D9A6_DERSI|nr:hypothetical protein HPB49_001015 [Dermacentor silvarum]